MTGSPESPPEDLDVFVLAGQSNMWGHGLLEDGCTPAPRVWSLSATGSWAPAVEPLHRMVNSFTPCHRRQLELNGHSAATEADWLEIEREHLVGGAGLGLPFANLLAESLDRSIGLIPAAHGGTSLDQWMPTESDEIGETLYGGMMRRIDRACGTLRGVLWFQGESDASSDALASYPERFSDWIAAVRRDTGIPRLPVFVVQVGCADSNEEYQFSPDGWDAIRAAQLSMTERIADAYLVSAIDVGLIDIVHLDTPGLTRVGRRLARVVLVALYNHPAGARVPHLAEVMPPTRAGTDTSLWELKLRFAGVNGALRPAESVAGFELLDVTGCTIPPSEGGVLTARVDPIRSDTYTLSVARRPTAGSCVAYGVGLHPKCNATDELDMGLPSFRAPIPSSCPELRVAR